MALAPSALVEQGRRLMSIVVAGFEAAKVNLPDRRYLAAGDSAPDDDAQLTVLLAGIDAGNPGRPDGQWQRSPAGFRTATWHVAILRAVAVQGEDGGFAPDPADVQLDAEAAWTDVAVLQDLLEAARGRKTLVGPGIPITISPVSVVGPRGGLISVQARVSLGLEGAATR